MPLENIITYAIVIFSVIISIFYFVKSIIDISKGKSKCSSCEANKVCKKNIKKP